MQPQSGFGGEYFHPDIPSMASAYLFHIVKNHPFVDGNKRTGALAAIVFVELNGHTIAADEDVFEQIVLDVASSQLDKETLIEWMKEKVKPMT